MCQLRNCRLRQKKVGIDDDMLKLQILKNAGINVVYADAGDSIKPGRIPRLRYATTQGLQLSQPTTFAVYLVEYGDFSCL